jgi:hypothetical protein
MSLRTGFHRGVVTRAGADGVYVQLPDLYGSSEIGPLDFIAPRLRRPSRSTDTANGPDAHTHNIGEAITTSDRFAGGDRVLVVSVGPGDWVVIGRLETGANQ